MSMAGYPDEFDWTELDTGLPNNFTGTIQNPVFKYDTDYQNGEVIQLVMDVMPLPGQEVETMQTIKYACKGWTTKDQGRTIVREDGKPKNFHESSAMGLAIKSLIESDVPVNDLVKAKNAVPLSVDFWDGVTFEWERKEHDYKGDIGKITRLLPCKLMDMGTGNNHQASATTPAPAPAQAPVAKATAPVAKAAATPAASASPLYDEAFKIAYDAESHEAMKAAIYENVAGATSDAELMVLVEDVGPDGLWGRAVAKYEADHA